MDDTKLKAIAKKVHFMHQKFLRTVFADYSLKDWEDAEDWQREDTMRFVKAVEDGQLDPKAEHEQWLEGKKRKGYVFGEVKNDDPNAGPLTNPNCLPWNELPDSKKFLTVNMLVIACAMCAAEGVPVKKSFAELVASI